MGNINMVVLCTLMKIYVWIILNILGCCQGCCRLADPLCRLIENLLDLFLQFELKQ